MRKQILILTGFFFCVGLLWGIWQQMRRTEQISQSTPLRVLCGEGWLSDEDLKAFALTHQVAVQHITYRSPTELVRQLANADGKVDVICASSLLIQSLAHNKWIRKINIHEVAGARELSVDFRSLPFDRNESLGLPLFWNLHGVLGPTSKKSTSLKELAKTEKLGLWMEPLSLLATMSNFGVLLESANVEGENETFAQEWTKFRSLFAGEIQPDPSDLGMTEATQKFAFLAVPLARVSDLMGKASWGYFLPEEGATVEVGLLSIGEASAQPKLAQALIVELLQPELAMKVVQRLRASSVHKNSPDPNGLAPWRRAEALRRFPLDRLRFPNIDIESLPKVASRLR